MIHIHSTIFPDFFWNQLETTIATQFNPAIFLHLCFFHQPSGKAQRLDSYVTQWALTCWNRKYMGSTGQCARWYSPDIMRRVASCLFSLFSDKFRHCANDLKMNWTWLEWLGLLMSWMLGSHFSQLLFSFRSFPLTCWTGRRNWLGFPPYQKPTTEEGLHSLKSCAA